MTFRMMTERLTKEYEVYAEYGKNLKRIVSASCSDSLINRETKILTPHISPVSC